MRATLLLAVLLCVPSTGARAELSGIETNERLSPGTVRRITWSLPGPSPRHGSELELVLSLDGGETFPLRVSPEASATRREAFFRVPNLPTRTARLGLRVGRDGEEERLCAVGESFGIHADPSAPLEPLRRHRGEPATLEAAPRPVSDRLPAAALSGVPETVSARTDATELDDDEGTPALSPPAASALPALSGERGAVAPSSAAPRSQSHPFRPTRE